MTDGGEVSESNTFEPIPSVSRTTRPPLHALYRYPLILISKKFISDILSYLCSFMYRHNPYMNRNSNPTCASTRTQVWPWGVPGELWPVLYVAKGGILKTQGRSPGASRPVKANTGEALKAWLGEVSKHLMVTSAESQYWMWLHEQEGNKPKKKKL